MRIIPYLQKYGIRDYRGGGRASARETMMRVAKARIAKKYSCTSVRIKIRGCLSPAGPIKLNIADWDAVKNNPFSVPNRLNFLS